MTTPELLKYHHKLDDIAERIESSHHYLLQLNLSKDSQKSIWGNKYERINIMYNKKIRIEEAHLKRLEKRYNDQIIRYVSDRL